MNRQGRPFTSRGDQARGGEGHGRRSPFIAAWAVLPALRRAGEPGRGQSRGLSGDRREAGGQPADHGCRLLQKPVGFAVARAVLRRSRSLVTHPVAGPGVVAAAGDQRYADQQAG